MMSGEPVAHREPPNYPEATPRLGGGASAVFLSLRKGTAFPLIGRPSRPAETFYQLSTMLGVEPCTC